MHIITVKFICFKGFKCAASHTLELLKFSGLHSHIFFLAFLSSCLLLCCSVSSLSSNSCWSFFLAKSISRMARVYFILHSPPGRKDIQFRKCLCDIWGSFTFNAGLVRYAGKKRLKSLEMMDAVYGEVHRTARDGYHIQGLT